MDTLARALADQVCAVKRYGRDDAMVLHVVQSTIYNTQYEVKNTDDGGDDRSMMEEEVPVNYFFSYYVPADNGSKRWEGAQIVFRIKQ